MVVQSEVNKTIVVVLIYEVVRVNECGRVSMVVASEIGCGCAIV